MNTRTLGLAALLSVVLIVGVAFAASEVDGKWDCTVTAAEGAHSFTLDLTTEGDKATGTIGSDVLTGTLKDNQLKLSGDYYIAEVGYSSTFDVSVELVEGKLKGSATWDVYSADFVGNRAD